MSLFRKKKIQINRHLFYETSHSPSLLDIIGEDMISKVTDFCFIANPYYPDKNLTKKLQEKLPVLIKSYPSSNPHISAQHLAQVLNVKPEQLIIGNGATELITIVQKEFISELAIPIPTFSEYIDTLRSHDSAKLFQLPQNKQYALDLTEYSEWINSHNISSALIINPGNPTGQLVPLSEMILFLETMKHLKHIIIDESFIDFASDSIPSVIPYIEKYPNVMVIRSMSKHCGVPGLRLGYCCTANTSFLETLRKRLPVWNINTVAEYFVSQLSATNAIYHETRKQVIRDVQELYTALSHIPGFEAYKTGSNFVMIKVSCGITATELQHILLEDFLVYVRDCSNKIGLDTYHIRVASQGKKKDALLIRALKTISKQYGC